MKLVPRATLADRDAPALPRFVEREFEYHRSVVTIDLLYPAAIPVGHRVELRWYEAPVGGFFGNKPVVVEHEPRVVDLDTGVEYGPLWMYSAAQGIRPGKPQELSAEPRDSLKEVRVLTGTVRASRVLTWAAGDGSTFLQTTLVVEES